MSEEGFAPSIPLAIAIWQGVWPFDSKVSARPGVPASVYRRGASVAVAAIEYRRLNMRFTRVEPRIPWNSILSPDIDRCFHKGINGVWFSVTRCPLRLMMPLATARRCESRSDVAERYGPDWTKIISNLIAFFALLPTKQDCVHDIREA